MTLSSEYYPTPQLRPERIDTFGIRPSIVSTSLGQESAQREVSSGDRSALLARLYTRLHELQKAKRLGTLLEHEHADIAELSGEIDRWEMQEASKASVWSEMDAIAADIVALFRSTNTP